MFKICFLPLLLWALNPASAAERFSGEATLSRSTAETSANDRFSLTAELQPAPAAAKTTADGRFSLIAELAAAKTALTACGPVLDPIFKNGFEN